MSGDGVGWIPGDIPSFFVSFPSCIFGGEKGERKRRRKFDVEQC